MFFVNIVYFDFSSPNWAILFNFKTNLDPNKVIYYSIKLTLLISFLLLMRGGTPRYRYDYLTKLGWLKFLSLCFFSVLNIILLYFVI